MTKRKRKLTPEQKAEKKRRQREYKTIFVGGKQKRVKRDPMVDGLPVDEFINRNADPIWLLQHGSHEDLHRWEQERAREEKEDFQQDECTVFDDGAPSSKP